MEITKGENANLAGLEPRCPKCENEKLHIGQGDGRFWITCTNGHATEVPLDFEVSHFAQFFRSPAPTPPLVDNNPVVCSMRAAALAFGGDEDLEKAVTEGRMNMQGEWPTPPLDVEAEKRIAEIRERESKATKGPWEVLSASFGEDEEGCNPQAILFEVLMTEPVISEPDGEFIGKSRLDIPFLLEQISLQRRHIASPAPQVRPAQPDTCKCPYAEDQSQEWHSVGSVGCKSASPAPNSNKEPK